MLKGSVVKAGELPENGIKRMFELMTGYYDNFKWENFIRDLRAKEDVILLKDGAGIIEGFSTIVIYDMPAGGKTVKLLFSGDTIVNHRYWSQNDLIPVWVRYAHSKAESLDEDLYWLLLSKGYKTYKYLSSFYREFYPRVDRDTPEFEQKIMDLFGKTFYPENYDGEKGLIIMNKKKEYLKDWVAEIPKTKLKDKNTAFFLKKNPGYRDGNEIVCIARLSRDNLNAAGRKMLGK